MQAGQSFQVYHFMHHNAYSHSKTGPIAVTYAWQLGKPINYTLQQQHRLAMGSKNNAAPLPVVTGAAHSMTCLALMASRAAPHTVKTISYVYGTLSLQESNWRPTPIVLLYTSMSHAHRRMCENGVQRVLTLYVVYCQWQSPFTARHIIPICNTHATIVLPQMLPSAVAAAPRTLAGR